MAEWKLLTTDEEIDAALAAAKLEPPEPRIVEAAYRPELGLELLVLKLSDGRRLAIPREELQVLANATPEQLAEFRVGPNGVNIWWPQIDEGVYLPHLLEGSYGTARWMAALAQRKVAA